MVDRQILTLIKIIEELDARINSNNLLYTDFELFNLNDLCDYAIIILNHIKKKEKMI